MFESGFAPLAREQEGSPGKYVSYREGIRCFGTCVFSNGFHIPLYAISYFSLFLPLSPVPIERVTFKSENRYY